MSQIADNQIATDQGANDPRPSLVPWNWIVTLSTIALVVLPIVVGGCRDEVASWHLAAAANALQLGDGHFEEHLQKAKDTGCDLEQLHDYWILQLMRALLHRDIQLPSADQSHPLNLPQIIREAKGAGADYRQLGQYAYVRLQARKEYETAIEICEITLTESQRATEGVRNQLAYWRSLIALDLDQALEDINEALEFHPKEPAYRDTRAWVLFQMGRPLEALLDAEFAVDKLEKQKQKLAKDPVSRLVRFLQPKPVVNAEQLDRPLTEFEAGRELWTEGVLRYHRARILETLGREERAQEDWTWIVEHNLPVDNKLQ